MNEKPQHPWIDPELEARIVTLVLGEASDADREEIEHLLEKRPELVAFKTQMESVHGLLEGAATGERETQDDGWQLSSQRRSAVLAAIGGKEERNSPQEDTIKSFKLYKSASGSLAAHLGKIAAVLCVAGVIGSLTLPALNSSRQASREPALPGPSYLTDNLLHSQTKGLPATTIDDYEKESQLALLAIRDNLERTELFSKEQILEESNWKFNLGFARSDTNGADELFEFDADGLPSSASEANAPQSGNGALAFSELTEDRLNLNASAPTKPNQSGSTSGVFSKSAGVDRYVGTRGATNESWSEKLGEQQDGPSIASGRYMYGGGLGGGGGGAVTGPPTAPQAPVLDSRFGLKRKKTTTELSTEELAGKDSGNAEETAADFGARLHTLPNEYLRRSQSDRVAGAVVDGIRLENEQQESNFNDQMGESLGTHSWHFAGENIENLASDLAKDWIPAGLNEEDAEKEAFSTFSLHVGDVSFKLAQAALAQGKWPAAERTRIEEFVNAFDYGDPMPRMREKVACRIEQAVHPFLQQRNLMRISLRTAAAGRSGDTPLRLTFLLDNSGSMERADRRQTVRRAFALLAQQLTSTDQVSLISFARQPRLLADNVSGSQSQQLVELIHNLPSEGGTNFEAALELASEKAREQQVEKAQNRIILLTDGAANLGDADPDNLARKIVAMRNAGIAFDAAGISADGLNDEILEALTRNGDGRYYLLDRPEDADDGFAQQIAGALRPAAKNVKVQIEFNPQRVGRYKLLGFEKHRLKQEDFRNDQVDAAEMAAEEAGVAVYQFEAKPDGQGDVGSVSVRFRDMSTRQMVEHRWPIPYEDNTPRVHQAAPSMRIAATAALLAAKLKGEPLGEIVDLKTLSTLLDGLPEQDRKAERVQQLRQMIQQARQLSGK
ncbi:MAG: von Willebrand factor type A domain-containing protein [Pirellulales bacterium]|nr:von Willebrand factor type A domain-containing protein [Pirellulales bacterium]